jgi:cysteinyl-tRNA synthetase
MAFELKLYDTLTRDKRVFVPIDPANVRMYVCGPTVYDFAHIGNARPVIVFDVLFRLLRHIYGDSHVTYVRNITDVDDKINARAARDYPGLPLNEAIRKVTEKTEQQFHADVDALGCLRPTVEPRATEHIGEMIDIIGRLLENGCAYIAHGPEGREVLFSVENMKRYGELSHRTLEDQREGARVAVEAHKRNPADFVLWKESSANQPGWPAKFRVKAAYPKNADEIEIFGRPGWHIECSAMSWKYLSEHFDIHGGGIDLVFPHHENELAQTCCAFGVPRMAETWMHNGFLQVEGEKMSKSLGNFFTIHELLADWLGDVLRFNMLRTHYRQPIDWTRHNLDESYNILWGWYGRLESVNVDDVPPESIIAALSDDLNTPSVIAELHTLNRRKNFSGLLTALRFLGFSGDRKMLRRPYIGIVEEKGEVLPLVNSDKVNQLIAARTAARSAKNFAESDRIRDELAAMGVVLKDSKEGTTWEIAR